MILSIGENETPFDDSEALTIDPNTKDEFVSLENRILDIGCAKTLEETKGREQDTLVLNDETIQDGCRAVCAENIPEAVPIEVSSNDDEVIEAIVLPRKWNFILSFGWLIYLGIAFFFCALIGGIVTLAWWAMLNISSVPTPQPTLSVAPSLRNILSPSYSFIPTTIPTFRISERPSLRQVTWEQVGDKIYEEIFENEMMGFSLSGDGATLALSGMQTVRLFEFNKKFDSWESTKEFSFNFRSGDFYRIALSSTGKSIIIGDYMHSRYTDNNGAAFVYHNQNDVSWEQRGSTLYGEKESDLFGWSIDINDNGEKIVVGSFVSGYVNIYDFLSQDWNLTKKIGGDYNFGYNALFVDNGNRLLVGNHINNNSKGSVYFYDSSSYNILQTINGDNDNDFFGLTYSTSHDGTVLAIGAISEYVKLFILDVESKKYVQLQRKIHGPDGSLFGFAVSVSGDGTKLCVGAPKWGKSRGIVYVFAIENMESWKEIGTLEGELDSDEAGRLVGMSTDGKIIAIASPFSSNENVRVYQQT